MSNDSERLLHIRACGVSNAENCESRRTMRRKKIEKRRDWEVMNSMVRG